MYHIERLRLSIAIVMFGTKSATPRWMPDGPRGNYQDNLHRKLRYKVAGCLRSYEKFSISSRFVFF